MLLAAVKSLSLVSLVAPVDRGAGLVGGEGHHVAHAGLEGGVDHVLGAVDIGLDALLRVIFGGVYLLDGGGVDDHVDALAGPAQAFAVAHVADEEAQLRIFVVGIFLFQLKLFELVARIDHDPFHVGISAKDRLNKFFTERTGASGDQN